MKTKKLLALCLTGSMLAASMAGCGTEGDSGGEGNEKENITLRVLATGTDYSDIIDQAVSEKFPEITLEWETISWNDLQ